MEFRVARSIFYGKTKAGEVEESHKEEKFGDICIQAQTGPPQEDDILQQKYDENVGKDQNGIIFE